MGNPPRVLHCRDKVKKLYFNGTTPVLTVVERATNLDTDFAVHATVVVEGGVNDDVGSLAFTFLGSLTSDFLGSLTSTFLGSLTSTFLKLSIQSTSYGGGAGDWTWTRTSQFMPPSSLKPRNDMRCSCSLRRGPFHRGPFCTPLWEVVKALSHASGLITSC